jgi:predicted flap endonuclease-1-like 5' DNA nuclease
VAYPITDIQVIGPDAADVLRKDGIRTTIALLRKAGTPKQRLRLAQKLGTEERCVLDWVTAADRMRVKGIGWEYAELLCAVGVKTVAELKYRNPAKLVEAMADANNTRRLVRLLPSERTVARWIEIAKALPAVVRY